MCAVCVDFKDRDCPDHLVEAAKLSHFFESLLTNHSLETLVAATVNSIQPRAGDSIKDFTAINMWYEQLNQRYNFSMEPIITALLTNDQLRQLGTLESPYLKSVNTSITNVIDRNKYQAEALPLSLSGTN